MTAHAPLAFYERAGTGVTYIRAAFESPYFELDFLALGFQSIDIEAQRAGDCLHFVH